MNGKCYKGTKFENLVTESIWWNLAFEAMLKIVLKIKYY